MTTRRSIFLISAAALSAFAAAVLSTGAASAHEGKAVITVDTATPGADGSVSYELRVVWDNDGHPAKDATVTAVGEAPDGSQVGPVGMQNVDDDGHYTGTLQFPTPGNWVVRFTVVEPPGSLEVPQVIERPSSSSAPTTSAPQASAHTSTTSVVAEPAANTEVEKSSAGTWVFVGAVAVVLIGAAALYLRNRRTNPPPD